MSENKDKVIVLILNIGNKQCMGKQCISWAQGYKPFFVLNSAEHEILNAHKYKSIKKFSIPQAKIRNSAFLRLRLSLERYFSCSKMLECQQKLLAF